MGPVKYMTPAQLDALAYGYTYSLLWVAGIAVIVGVTAFWIGFSARQIASAQHTREAVEAGKSGGPTTNTDRKCLVRRGDPFRGGAWGGPRTAFSSVARAARRSRPARVRATAAAECPATPAQTQRVLPAPDRQRSPHPPAATASLGCPIPAHARDWRPTVLSACRLDGVQAAPARYPQSASRCRPSTTRRRHDTGSTASSSACWSYCRSPFSPSPARRCGG